MVNEPDFPLVVDAIPAMAWSARADGAGNFFNRRYLDYVGLAAEQLSGWQWTSVIHPDDIERVMACWEAFNAAGKGGEIEARLRRHDGVYRWFSFRSSASLGVDGKVAQWFGLNIDIEDQKRTEIMLAGERRLLELVASSRPIRDILLALCEVIEQAAPDCQCEIRALDATGTVYEIAVAPTLPCDLIERVPGTALVDDMSPAGRAAAHKTTIIAKNVATDPRWHNKDIQKCLLDEGLRSACGVPISSKDGAILGSLCIYRPETGEPRAEHQDILQRAVHISSIAIERYRAENELKRREFLLVTAERISETGSFSWDLVHDKLIWSEQMYRIWEIDPSLPLGPTNLMPMVHPDDAAMVQERVDRMRQGLDNPEDEERILMPDGRIKWMSNSTLVFHHDDGRVECVGVSQDITRRRLAEQASEKLRSELAHVTRVLSLGELAASIAHEVNQPLSGIITNANTCLRMLATDPPNIEGAIRTAERSVRDGNRAAEVIKRLRSLYRKQDFALESLDLNDAAREVIAICAHDLQRRRIAMTVDLENELPHVTGDRIQLQQVILNLVLNAADALTDVEDRRRQISILTAQSRPGLVQLMVRDTGAGVAEEDRERIFEPFCTTKPNGMGIGLSVSRSIIDRHKGKLWTTSNEGPGAIFAFSLPTAAENELHQS